MFLNLIEFDVNDLDMVNLSDIITTMSNDFPSEYSMPNNLGDLQTTERLNYLITELLYLLTETGVFDIETVDRIQVDELEYQAKTIYTLSLTILQAMVDLQNGKEFDLNQINDAAFKSFNSSYAEVLLGVLLFHISFKETVEVAAKLDILRHGTKPTLQNFEGLQSSETTKKVLKQFFKLQELFAAPETLYVLKTQTNGLLTPNYNLDLLNETAPLFWMLRENGIGEFEVHSILGVVKRESSVLALGYDLIEINVSSNFDIDSSFVSTRNTQDILAEENNVAPQDSVEDTNPSSENDPEDVSLSSENESKEEKSSSEKDSENENSQLKKESENEDGTSTDSEPENRSSDDQSDHEKKVNNPINIRQNMIKDMDQVSVEDGASLKNSNSSGFEYAATEQVPGVFFMDQSDNRLRYRSKTKVQHVATLGSSSYVAELKFLNSMKGSETTIQIPAGVTIVCGRSSVGKSTLVRSIMDRISDINYIVGFLEPDETAISDNQELEARLNEVLAESDIVALDSARYFMYGGRSSALPGAINGAFFNMIAELSSNLARDKKAMFLVVNPLTGDREAELFSKIVESIKGSATAMLLINENFSFSFESRLNNRRRDVVCGKTTDIISGSDFGRTITLDSEPSESLILKSWEKEPIVSPKDVVQFLDDQTIKETF